MQRIISVDNLKLYKNKKLQIGLFGGSFDPAHIGHLHLAKNALEKLNLNEVWFDVANQNPTKKLHKYSFEERCGLVLKIINPYPRLKLLKIEEELNIVLTIEVVRYLKNILPEIEFNFLIGADLASTIHEWDCFEEIMESLKLVIFSRSLYSNLVKESYAYKKYSKNQRVIFIETEEINISSTEIRNRSKEL